MNPEADVVVIGGGINGLASAFYLARAGKRVVLAEKGVIGGEASGRNGGHLSPTIDATWGPFGLLAYELWPALVDELGAATEYRRSGGVYVIMGDEPIEPAQIQQFRQQHGYTAEVLSPEDCRKLIPGLRTDVKGGLFSPKSAHINPIVTMKLLARAAAREGVAIREHCVVTSIETRAGVIEGVDTELGRISAPIVVNAAGPWASAIGEMAGVRIPVEPRRIQILLS